jgi:hypothetical protein
MSGETLDYKKHLSLQIGQYFQVHEEDSPHNSQIERTKGAISLGPSRNMQGGFKCMALNTGKKIVCRSWDSTPRPDLVMFRFKALCSNQPHQMKFTNKHGRLLGDIDSPGVDADKDNNEPFPGVLPVIADDSKTPGVDLEVPETQDELPAPQVEIDDLVIHHDDPSPIEVAPIQSAQGPYTLAPVAPPT